jgi:hypothetical protein
LSGSYSQNIEIKDEINNPGMGKTFPDKNPGTSLIKEADVKTKSIEVTLYRYSLNSVNPQSVSKKEEPVNVVSSFRSNIRFGGFWDKYAIVNFTPEMLIKPVDFISFYAHHNISYFVPVSGIKEHFKSLALQSAAVLLVDNSIKFLMPSSNLIKSVVSFAVKNLVIFYMNKSIVNRGSEPVVEYGYYYYSVSIRF